MQLEAQIRIEAGVDKWIQEAGQLMLKAQMAEAESVYATALTQAPRSKRAQYRTARFHYDNGDHPKGLQLLRQFGMLLDVPLFDTKPEVDGELDEGLWNRAARVDSFFQFSVNHAPRSELGTELYVADTSESLLIGFYGHDDHPDSLVVKIKPGDEVVEDWGSIQTTIWTDDIRPYGAMQAPTAEILFASEVAAY